MKIPNPWITLKSLPIFWPSLPFNFWRNGLPLNAKAWSSPLAHVSIDDSLPIQPHPPCLTSGSINRVPIGSRFGPHTPLPITVEVSPPQFICPPRTISRCCNFNSIETFFFLCQLTAQVSKKPPLQFHAMHEMSVYKTVTTRRRLRLADVSESAPRIPHRVSVLSNLLII